MVGFSLGESIMTRRSSVIRQRPYHGNGSAGPDTYYVVEMYENEKLIETRELPGKSFYYAESCARNWDQGIIKDDK
jgi:hypothetical protein